MKKYFYKKKLVGGKGPRGELGDKGIQGKNDLCDICTLKPQRIKRGKKLEETTLVEEPVNMELLNNEIKGWNKTDSTLAIGDSKYCNTCKTKNYIYQPDIKFLTGITTNFNKETQSIETLQFLYKNSNNETKLHGGKNGIWGSSIKREGIQEVICPVNSAIYKIDTMYITSNPKRNSTINGITIHCKDIMSQKETLLETSSVGVSYDHESNIYKSGSIVCPDISKNDKMIPGYFSDLSATYENKINEVRFTKCNYYHG